MILVSLDVHLLTYSHTAPVENNPREGFSHGINIRSQMDDRCQGHLQHQGWHWHFASQSRRKAESEKVKEVNCMEFNFSSLLIVQLLQIYIVIQAVK